jgi:hypothetical protein
MELPTTRTREPALMVHGYAVDVAALTPAQKKQIETIANRIRLRLAKQPSIWVEADIEGHTDSTHTETYNKDLGLRRATAVADQLRSLFSARFRDRVYLNARSVGETEPIASNKAEKTRSRNRRVELSLEWVAPRDPAPTKPPRPPKRPEPPRRIVLDTTPCFEFKKLRGIFLKDVAALETILNSTFPRLDDEGQIVLEIKDKKALAQALVDIAIGAAAEKVFGTAQDKIAERVLGKDLAEKFGWALSTVEMFGRINRDIKNMEIMNDRDKLYEHHRKLVSGAVADAKASRDRTIDRWDEYIRLYKTWNRFGELRELCERSRGRANEPQKVWAPRIP